MNQFLFAFATILAVAYAKPGGYGGHVGPVIGGYAHQTQPAISVKYLVPTSSYGAPAYGKSAPSYSAHSAPSYSAPARSSYGGGVDSEALQLAYLGLAAPSAGGPIAAHGYNSAPGSSYNSLAPSYGAAGDYGASHNTANSASAAAAASAIGGHSGQYGAPSYAPAPISYLAAPTYHAAPSYHAAY